MQTTPPQPPMHPGDRVKAAQLAQLTYSHMIVVAKENGLTSQHSEMAISMLLGMFLSHTKATRPERDIMVRRMTSEALDAATKFDAARAQAAQLQAMRQQSAHMQEVMPGPAAQQAQAAPGADTVPQEG